VSDSPWPDIREFSGCLRLNQVASRWGAEIGRDPDALACAILAAYAAGEFDSIKGEVFCGLNDFNQFPEPFSINKAQASFLANKRTSYNGCNLMSLEYRVYVTILYIRPKALAIFAKRRELTLPMWLKPTGSAEPAKHPGGAPEKYDWALVEEILEEECKKQGSIPRRDHCDPEWREQAHAIKHVCERMAPDWRDGEPVDSTLKARIGPMLKRIDERMKAGN